MSDSHVAWEALLDTFEEAARYDEATGGLNTYRKNLAREALERYISDSASRADVMRNALERACGCIRGLLARTPVRDVSETLAEIAAALAKNPNPSGQVRAEALQEASGPVGLGPRHCTNCRGRGWVNEPHANGLGVRDVPCPKCSAPHSSYNVPKE